MAIKETTPTPSAGHRASGSHGGALGAHDPARDKAIELALGSIEKQFGKGAIMRLGKDAIEREVAT